MLELYAPPPLQNVLIDADLVVHELEHKGVPQERVIETLRGRRNRIQVGTPQTVDVLDAWPVGEQLAVEIAAFADRFDFYSVRLACSFIPDHGCRFVWARLAAALSSPNEGSSEPLAFDLFPRDVGEKRTFKRAFGISPKLHFAFAEVAANAGTETETVRYEPTITATGLLTSEPRWTFTSVDRSGLAGSRELFVLVKAAKGTALQVSFGMGAEVQTRVGLVPLRRYGEEELVHRSYPLVP